MAKICDTCAHSLYNKTSWQAESGYLSDGTSFYPNLVLKHHKTGFALKEAVASGCRLCTHYWDSCTEKNRSAFVNDVVGNYEMYFSLATDESRAPNLSLRLQMQYQGECDRQGTNVDDREPSALDHYTLVPSHDLRDFTFGSPSSNSTSSDECWDMILNWSRICRHQHTRCKSVSLSRENQWYPTRLLDLGGVGSDVPVLKLIETKDFDMQNSPYVTLSHCWGRRPVLTLTRESFSSFQQGIPVSTLPKTFRETVVIARRLSIRFLWIDSMCIIQNDPDLADWLRESTLMNRVYSHAMYNISAAGSRDSAGGLFYARNPSDVSVLELDLCVDLAQWRLSDSPPTSRYMALLSKFWSKELGEAPLNCRGWVLQERLLSQRVIHFGRNQVFWECQQLDACETFPLGLPREIKERQSGCFKTLDFEMGEDEDGPSEHAEGGPEQSHLPHDLWPRIVTEYSSTSLTKSQDKLIAIAGVAKRMREIIEDEYVVGMWRRYLASELLWRVAKQQINNTPTSRPAVYHCPSFSWASIDGVIEPGVPSANDIVATVKEVQIEHVTDDTTGLVKGGHIIIQGPMNPVKIHRPPPAYYWRVEADGIKEVQSDNGQLWGHITLLVYLDVQQDDFDAENAAGSLYCLCVYSEAPEKSFNRGPRVLASFLLLQSIDHHGSFRRLGLVEAYGQDEFDISSSPAADPAAIPCLEYDEASNTHTIRLV